MAIALVSSVKKPAPSSSTDPLDTSSIDSTGANLLVVVAAALNDNAFTVSDSKSNSWNALTKRVQISGHKVQIFYSYGTPTVGSGHTFRLASSSGYKVVIAYAFSGADTTPYDAESGAASGGSGTTIQPGSITPSADGCALVSGLASYTSSVTSINSSFTMLDHDFDGNALSTGGAYLIQPTAAAVNPTWTHGDSYSAAVMAAFKPAGGGGGLAIPIAAYHYNHHLRA